MGLFDKKYCDFCGKKIGLLGNKKLEDGNMCRECAGKLSPWFSERRHSSREEIASQLAYREENRAAVAAFRTTRSIGRHTKLLIDEDARKFMVTSERDLAKANPDVLNYSQVTGCELNVEESSHELKQSDKDGKQVSYHPPRYEYSYDFRVTIHVNHTYFDQIRYSVSNGYVKTGERRMAAVPPGWRLNRAGSFPGRGEREYYEYMEMSFEIRDAVDTMRLESRLEAAAKPKKAVECPCCGATTVPDEKGCCEYCGSALS